MNSTPTGLSDGSAPPQASANPPAHCAAGPSPQRHRRGRRHSRRNRIPHPAPADRARTHAATGRRHLPCARQGDAHARRRPQTAARRAGRAADRGRGTRQLRHRRREIRSRPRNGGTGTGGAAVQRTVGPRGEQMPRHPRRRHPRMAQRPLDAPLSGEIRRRRTPRGTLGRRSVRRHAQPRASVHRRGRQGDDDRPPARNSTSGISTTKAWPAPPCCRDAWRLAIRAAR